MAAPNFKDMTGKRFDRLIVNKFSHINKHNHACWECTCDCGNKKIVTGYSLRNCASKSCGCLRKERTGEVNRIDLTGKIFGKLVAIKETGEKNKWGDIKWLCKCSCGKETVVTCHRLQSGHTKSCGCLSKEQTTRIDITGKKFGKLTVINYSHTKNKKAYWNCKCDCGNNTIVSSGCLSSGNTKSCGCETSHGNNKITEVLTLLNIKFEKEKKFPDCKNKRPLPFDFYLPDYDIAIEFQGRQHYAPTDWSRTKEKNRKNFEQTQKHDQIKRDYCKQNNIELLEISYKDFGNIKTIIESLVFKS